MQIRVARVLVEPRSGHGTAGNGHAFGIVADCVPPDPAGGMLVGYRRETVLVAPPGTETQTADLRAREVAENGKPNWIRGDRSVCPDKGNLHGQPRGFHLLEGRSHKFEAEASHKQYAGCHIRFHRSGFARMPHYPLEVARRRAAFRGLLLVCDKCRKLTVIRERVAKGSGRSVGLLSFKKAS